MIKRLIVLFFAILFLPKNSFAILDPANRPPELRAEIDRAFSEVSANSSSNWLYNGSPKYFIADLDEHQLALGCIKNQPEKKDFYFMDLGAGNFEWVDAMAEFINSNSEIPEGIRVHIIGARGEKYGPSNFEAYRSGKCRIHKFGNFKIEDLQDSLKDLHNLLIDKGLAGIIGQIDLIVSRWTLRHLVDPVGTLKLAFDCLTPGHGLMLFDGFFFLLNQEKLEDLAFSKQRIDQLLFITGQPFLRFFNDSGRCLNDFVIKRASRETLNLPLTYNCTIDSGKIYQCGSERFTIFNLDPSVKLPYFGPRYHLFRRYMGSEDLFKLVENATRENPDEPISFRPLIEEDL